MTNDPQVDTETMNVVFQMLDADGSGDISFAEFILILVVAKIAHRTLDGGQERILRNSQALDAEIEGNPGDGAARSSEVKAKTRANKLAKENEALNKKVCKISS